MSATVRLPETFEELEAEYFAAKANGGKLTHNEYDMKSLAETLDIMSCPETMASLERGLADAAAGRIHKWDEINRDS